MVRHLVLTREKLVNSVDVGGHVREDAGYAVVEVQRDRLSVGTIGRGAGEGGQERDGIVHEIADWVGGRLHCLWPSERAGAGARRRRGR